MENYIKNQGELVGGGSPRYLNTLSNLCCWLSTTHTSIHYVFLLFQPVPMYTMLSKISAHPIPRCYYCCTEGQLQLP